jgi:hypothetical protein
MSFKVSLSDDSTFIVMEVTGEVTRENAMQYNLEAHKLGKKHGLSKYLVDFTKARNTETVINNYKFAYEDMKHTPGIDILAIVAVIVEAEDHSHDFIETVARNSGLNITLFRDKEKALEFLRSK